MIRVCRIVLWLLLAVGLMAQATPTPTPGPGASSCTISGYVYNPDGSPFVGNINFNSKVVQVVGGTPIYPTIVNTSTNASGAISAVSLPKSLVMQITMCPNAAQAGGCSAAFSAIVPNTATSDFGHMITGAFLAVPIPNPASAGVVFGSGPSFTPEWETVSGGAGNCAFQWMSAGNYQLNCPAYLASPAFTGIPTAPTATVGTNTTQLATTAFVLSELTANVVGVSSFNTRVGAVTLQLSDVTGVGGAPAASPSFTGTMTFPDSSTYTSAGHNSMKGLGVGVPVPSDGTTLAMFEQDANKATDISVNNASTGVNAVSTYYLGNATHYGAMQLVGTGNTTQAPFPADIMQVETNTVNGIAINSATTGPIQFWVASNHVGDFNANGLVLYNAAGSDVFWGSATQPYATISVLGAANMGLAAGAHVANGTGQWTADATSATVVGQNVGAIGFYANSGLTVGNTFPFNQLASVDVNGFNVEHVMNLHGAGIPTLAHGTLAAGSRDTIGVAEENDGGSTMTLTFSRSFIGQSVCTLSDYGNDNAIWTQTSAGPGSTGFTCALNTGAACVNHWVAYHCFGLGS